MVIPVRSAVSIILVLEKCVSWAFYQSTLWCLLKTSFDTCLRPRASSNSCLLSRSSRPNSFTFSRYRVRLASAGLSTLFLSTTTTEDTTELWGVDDSASSASIGVEPGNLSGCSSSCLMSRPSLPGDWTGFLWQGKGDLGVGRMSIRPSQAGLPPTHLCDTAKRRSTIPHS